MKRGGCVYILTNKYHTVLYTGVTSDLEDRMYKHINKVYPDSFTAKYNCTKLVYYTVFHRIEDAIAEEKRIKAGSRKSKIEMITSLNPHWHDLWDDFDW